MPKKIPAKLQRLQARRRSKNDPETLNALTETTEILRFHKLWTELEFGLIQIWRKACDSEWELQEVARIAFLSAALLNDLAKKKPDQVKKLSLREIHWPVIAPKSKAGLERIYDELSKLGIGDGIFAPLDSEKFQSRESPVRIRLLRYTAEINSIRRMGKFLRSESSSDEMEVLEPIKRSQNIADARISMTRGFRYLHQTFRDRESYESKIADLPDLSTATVKKWFPYVWDILIEDTNGLPEEQADLKIIGNAKPDNPRDVIRTRFNQVLTSLVKSAT